MLEQILFYVYATAVLIGAVAVITNRNPVHSALWLVFTFISSSGLWLIAGAEFLAIVLVLVYVGAVMVLFLFVIMMLDVKVEAARRQATRYGPLGILTALVVIGELAYVIWVQRSAPARPMAAEPLPQGYSNTEALGKLLYTDYFYPFEIAAVLLLVAIIAAIVLTMRTRPGLKKQDIARQVATRREDRVRIVSMPAETRR